MLTAAYCTLTLATAKALQGTLQAVPTSVLHGTDCTMLTTEALLLLLSLSACIDPSTVPANQSSNSSTGYSQQVPPGVGVTAAQQLQSGMDAICSAGSTLLEGGAPELSAHLGSALLLAILPVMQAIPSGRLWQSPTHEPLMKQQHNVLDKHLI